MTNKYSKGQILRGNKNKHKDAIHPIVYLTHSLKSTDHFIGLMLTSTNNYSDRNLKMEIEHFENGFVYQNTHVVKAILMKPTEWEPFRMDGNLSPLGIKFIEDNIPFTEEILWQEYLASHK